MNISQEDKQKVREYQKSYREAKIIIRNSAFWIKQKNEQSNLKFWWYWSLRNVFHKSKCWYKWGKY